MTTQPTSPKTLPEKDAIFAAFASVDHYCLRSEDLGRMETFVTAEDYDKLLEAHRVALAAQPIGVIPEGMALVPIRMTQEMSDVTNEEGWQWEDVLAAAGAITSQQYDEASAAPQPPAGQQQAAPNTNEINGLDDKNGSQQAASAISKTGWPPGMLQDDDRGLSQWLASKPDARKNAREAAPDPHRTTTAVNQPGEPS